MFARVHHCVSVHLHTRHWTRRRCLTWDEEHGLDSPPNMYPKTHLQELWHPEGVGATVASAHNDMHLSHALLQGRGANRSQFEFRGLLTSSLLDQTGLQPRKECLLPLVANSLQDCSLYSVFRNSHAPFDPLRVGWESRSDDGIIDLTYRLPLSKTFQIPILFMMCAEFFPIMQLYCQVSKIMCSDIYMFRSGTNMLLLNKRNNTKVVLMDNSIQFVFFWRPHNLFC